jgi:hypothetical protein
VSEPTETQAETATAAEIVAELVGTDSRDHEYRVAKLAHSFLTHNAPGLGQVEKGDEERWSEINLLAKYPDVEGAYCTTAIDALRLLSHAFRGARQ